MRNRIHWMTCSLVVAAVLAASMPLAAQTSVFVTMTNRPEEALTWCGAAAGQMILASYPPPASSCPLPQADVWAEIQTYKVEASWDTDPAGLQGAMNHLCPPPGGHWAVVESSNATSVMHAVAYWMNTNHYAVAALLKTAPHNAIATHREDWVTIKGIVTDLDPRTNPAATLLQVTFVEQAPNIGDPPTERTASGSVWYTLFKAVTLSPSTHNGNFVTVIEPPPTSGTLVAKAQPVTGTIIAPERAVEAAKLALQRDLSFVPAFREMANLQPGKPILVNPQRRAYYLVPLSGAERRTAAAIVINAYSGEFMEAGRFKPRPMLAEPEAVERAVKFTGRRPARPKATLVAPSDDPPYFPSWRVTLDDQQLLVDPEGNVRKVRMNEQ